MTKIDCVTVSIGFDDYLSLTLPYMMHCFDRVAVVTEAADEATCKVAEEAGAVVVRSERKQFAGEPFNLPALINDGVAALGPTEWIAKIDSDIYLPWSARTKLETCLDDPDVLWGSRRYFCETIAAFRHFDQHQKYELLEPPYEDEDPDVLGFFQLAHVGSKYLDYAGRGTFYVEDRYEGPSRTNDRLLSGFYPKEKRRRTPFDVVHLGLDAIGTNWKGRKAPRFF